MKLIDMLNQVLSQSGFLERGSYVNSNDPDDKQMIAISNRVAYEMMNWFPWPELRKPFTITMRNLLDDQDEPQPSEPQIRYRLPDDFQSLIPESVWEQDGQRQAEFPVPSGRWFQYKFTNWSDGGTLRMRMYGNEVEIHDVEPGQSIDMEYISKYPVKDESGALKASFNNDNDEFLLDDQVLILGIQAHWMQTKLMPQYQEHYSNYLSKMAESISRSSGSRTLGGRSTKYFGRGAPYYPLYRKA
jgi:hypothetical protein